MSPRQAESSKERREVLRGNLVAQYERMLEIRYLEDRVNGLFAEGKVHGTTHTCQGQEAVAVGIAAATDATDQVVGTYRGHGLALALGSEPSQVLGEIMGRTSGSLGGVGGSMHLCDPTIGLLPTMAIVGAGLPIATGAALSASVLGKNSIALAVFGDGAANIGAFHESLNLAAVWRLPVVFICENNLYGEYTRIDRSTPIADIAARAASYGIPGSTLDGQNVEEVAAGVEAASTAARNGEGPQLLEAKTYRYSGHSRADTGPYRPDGELDEWLQNDPIENLGKSLTNRGDLTDSELERLTDAVRARIDTLVDETSSKPVPGTDAMFQNVYASS